MIIFDTSFVLSCVRQGIDFIAGMLELGLLDLVVPKQVISELEKLSRDKNLTIKQSGNVGIGTTSPSAKLAVNGGLHVGGDSDPGDNNCTVDGELLAATVATNASYSWTLAGYTTTAPAATGYVSVTIEGTSYKLLAATA